MHVQDAIDSDTTFPFRHHQYAPSAPPRPRHVHPLVGEWVTDVPLELFTISQSVAANPVSIISSLPPILLVLINFHTLLSIHSLRRIEICKIIEAVSAWIGKFSVLVHINSHQWETEQCIVMWGHRKSTCPWNSKLI
jgi:hypothetical protein